MGISSYTLLMVTRYAKENNWIVSQGRYYVNPHHVKIEGGMVIRDEAQHGRDVAGAYARRRWRTMGKQYPT